MSRCSREFCESRSGAGIPKPEALSLELEEEVFYIRKSNIEPALIKHLIDIVFKLTQIR